MNKKTKQLIAKIIVFILTALLVLSAVLPYVFGADGYVTYSNKKLHMKFKIPADAKSGMDTISENGREFPIDFYMTARVIYGDIYEEVLEQNKLTSKSLDRSQVYIKSKYVQKTWGNKTYVTKYFRSILDDAKSGYTCEITQAKLSGIPAWRCYYKGKDTQSAGYYFLTVNNGGLHVLQLDVYLKSISGYKSTVKKIKESYKITDLKIPSKEGSQTAAAGNKKNKGTTASADKNEPQQETGPKINMTFSKPAKILLAVIGILAVVAGITYYVLNMVRSGKLDEKREQRKRNRTLKVTRKNNRNID